MTNTIKTLSKTIQYQDKTFTVALNYFHDDGDINADIFEFTNETFTIDSSKNSKVIFEDLPLDQMYLYTPADLNSPASAINSTNFIYGQPDADKTSDYTAFKDDHTLKTVKGNVYTSIKNVVRELAEELETLGIESPMLADKRREDKEEIAEAKHVIEKAKKSSRGVDNLMTGKERYDYLIRLNNVENEGGEGYLPEIITQNQYDEAIKALTEKGISIE